MVKKDMICISCPIGCRLEVEMDDSGQLKVKGNKCPRGPIYAEAELKAPLRIVTAALRIDWGDIADGGLARPAMAPCRTRHGFPKDKIAQLLKEIRSLRISPPITRGQLIIGDALGTGVDVVATRSIARE